MPQKGMSSICSGLKRKASCRVEGGGEIWAKNDPHLRVAGTEGQESAVTDRNMDISRYWWQRLLKTLLVIFPVIHIGCISNNRCLKCIATAWQLLFLLFIHAVTLSLLYNIDLLDVWYVVLLIIDSFMCVICVDWLFIMRNKQIRVLFDFQLKYNDQPRKGFHVKYICSLILVCIIAFVVVDTFLTYNYFVGEVVTDANIAVATPNGTKVNTELFVISFVKYNSFPLFIRGTVSLIVLFYICVCRQIKQDLDAIMASQDLVPDGPLSEAVHLTSSKIAQLRESVLDVVDVIKTLDSTFSLPTFIWSIFFVTEGCVQVTAFVSAIDPQEMETFEEIFGGVIDGLYFCYVFVGVVLSAGMIAETGDDFASFLTSLMITAEFEDEKQRFQMDVLCSILRKQTKMSAMGYFNLTKGTILTTFGVLASYLVVIIQMGNNLQGVTRILAEEEARKKEYHNHG